MVDHPINYIMGCRSIYDLILKFPPIALPMPCQHLPPLNTTPHASHSLQPLSLITDASPPPTSRYRCLCLSSTYDALPVAAYAYKPPPTTQFRCLVCLHSASNTLPAAAYAVLPRFVPPLNVAAYASTPISKYRGICLPFAAYPSLSLPTSQHHCLCLPRAAHLSPPLSILPLYLLPLPVAAYASP